MDYAKKKAIKLLLNTTINKNAEKEQFSLRGEGVQYEKNGYTYVLFQEYQSDGDKVNTTVKIGKNEVTLIRNGPVSMRQNYQLGEETSGRYATSFGTWDTKAYTRQLSYLHKKGSYELFLEYDFTLQDELLGIYEWLMIVEEA